MSHHEHGEGAEILRKGHEAFNNRDRDALLDLIAEDVTWHVAGEGPAAGTYESRDALWEEFFTAFWDAPVRVEDHDVLDSGEHVVALGDLVFDLGGDTRSWRIAEVVHLDDDGRVSERWAFTENQAELDAFLEQMAGQQQ